MREVEWTGRADIAFMMNVTNPPDRYKVCIFEDRYEIYKSNDGNKVHEMPMCPEDEMKAVIQTMFVFGGI